MAGRKKSRNKKKYYPKQIKKIAFWPSAMSLALGSSIGFVLGRYSQVNLQQELPNLSQYKRYLETITNQLTQLQQQALPSDAKAEELKNRIQDLIAKSQELENAIASIRMPDDIEHANLQQLQSLLSWTAPLYAGLWQIVPKIYEAARLNESEVIPVQVAGMSYAVFSVLNTALTAADVDQKLAARAVITNLASQTLATYRDLLRQPLLGTRAMPQGVLQYPNYWSFIYDSAKNGQDLSAVLVSDFMLFLRLS